MSFVSSVCFQAPTDPSQRMLLGLKYAVRTSFFIRVFGIAFEVWIAISIDLCMFALPTFLSGS